MIRFKILKVMMIMGLSLVCSIMQAQQYPKVIIKGDYADPTIMRDGKDYYMTHSPFYYMPGFLIWHSQDLMNWTPICRAMTEWKGSAMAPDLLKHNGRYYIYYPAAGTNWVIWADDIRGPWSEPIDLKVGGIDPGHIVDQKGNRYLHLSAGDVVRLTDDGLATVGKKQRVYDGWVYPKEWDTECMCLESPKLNYKDGYYYLTSAEGGTAGPATSHMVVSARSKTPLGPWENSPYNPIVHTYSDTERWWSKGHGTLIDDVNGNWWIVYHAYEKGYHTLGRQTLIEPIEWTADGWFRTKPTNPSIQPEKQIKHGMTLSDDFSTSDLGLQWTFWREYALKELNIGGGRMRMKAKGNTPADARLLLTTAEDKVYETQVDIQVGSGNVAGLMLFYNEQAYAGITSDGKNFTIYKNGKNSLTLPNTIGKRFLAQILNYGNRMTIKVSRNGQTWDTLAENIDVSSLHHNVYKGFYALRIGLLSAKKGTATFRDFRYRKTIQQNPVIPGYHSDPYVMYSENTKKYYIYPTTDGIRDWNGTQFKVFSSSDLKNWNDEGVILDLRNVDWAKRNAWAPSIIEKKQSDGSYKYYYYYTGNKQIGVAVGDSPTGPFVDSCKPLIDNERPLGMKRGLNIDPDVFCDPVSGKNYLYWGNYFMAVCELNDDMVSIKPGTTHLLIDNDKYYSEATHVFYRDGYYYFMWSKNDTRSPDYEVRYVRSKSPIGPINPAESKVILSKRPSHGIFATGHHSVLRLPGTDKWRIVYHRFSFPDAITKGWDAGYYREVCIDTLEFDKDGNIIQVKPSL